MPRELKPCGTQAAAKRHERNPAKYGPLGGCSVCRAAETKRLHNLRQKRQAKKT